MELPHTILNENHCTLKKLNFDVQSTLVKSRSSFLWLDIYEECEKLGTHMLLTKCLQIQEG